MLRREDGDVLRREDGNVLRREDGDGVLSRKDGDVLRRALDCDLKRQRRKEGQKGHGESRLRKRA